MTLARSGLFQPVELRRRVFKKAGGTGGLGYAPRRAPTPAPHLDPEQVMQQVGFESGPIAQLVVDRDGTLTLANHEARLLFNLAEGDVGKPLKDLEVSYRPVELRSQIERVYADHHSVSIRDVRSTLPTGEEQVMDVQIVPLLAGDGAVVGTGISFVDITRYKLLQDALEESKGAVETAYEELESTAEEMETTNEELQSTNEELETTNEELQSTNEELETMNEELTSTNEELETINDELNLRTDELAQTNLFLESILGSLEAGVIVLDRELRVIAWNDGARELWGLSGDAVRARHFLNLDVGLPVDRVRTAVRDLLAGNDHSDALELPATDRRGRAITCRVRLSPLTGDDGPPPGVILFMEAVDR
jgi:two-component system CheB/CheR fusion protein